ncbi:MAG: type VI secretion system tip protein TssI/VgrG, partial [Beijerinckiaceae bacterium]|nr:type VI secretion system tip protein TssI/VgrG [Beijerinckiaceae bacterium]
MTSERVPYTQSGRMMAIATPLGQDVLLLEHLAIDEGINGLFTIEAAVKSQRDDLQASDLIGASVDFRLKLKDDGTRWWNGFVTDLHEGSLTSRGTRSYGLTVRPKLWTLSQTSNCRKFQNLASQAIVEQLCKEHGISDLDLRVTGSPAAQEYSVQWNETDLDYMLRRMQQDGLFYWFEHQQGKHTLVVADHVSGYRDSSEPQVRYSLGSAAQDHISAWRRSFAFTSGKRSGRDWNFLTMSAPEGDQTSFDIVPGSAATERYEFPGLFSDSTSAEQAMKYRIQATETGYETVAAASTVRTLAPGQRFTPQDVANPSDTFAQQVLLTIRHVAHDQTYEAAATSRPSYDNTFTAMPATTPATPHRTIPRPRIVGSQIALIAGPSGEEIYTEQFGRVKVWFPWDREAQKDGSDTPWIRVGQPWAGTTWGHQVIPRIGMEAVVSYQEGDPNRPFITAVLPDPTNPVPYTLPDNKTRMVFRSKSYKSSGNNEMTFED